MTLQWSPESIHDLLALRAHIAEHDPAAAKRVALHILYCVENSLSENRRLGAPGRVPGTRELVIPKTPYIVPYRVRGTKVEIARVYHTSPVARPPLAHRATRRANRPLAQAQGDRSAYVAQPRPDTSPNPPKSVTCRGYDTVHRNAACPTRKLKCR
jgi:toxin ParE1/3/4